MTFQITNYERAVLANCPQDAIERFRQVGDAYDVDTRTLPPGFGTMNVSWIFPPEAWPVQVHVSIYVFLSLPVHMHVCIYVCAYSARLWVSISMRNGQIEFFLSTRVDRQGAMLHVL